MDKGTRSSGQAPVGLGAVAKSDSKTRVTPSSSETIAGDVHMGAGRARSGGLSSSDSVAGGVKQKICCACGKDVAHEERFKDRAGHYWCMDCGVQENRQKHALAHAAQSVPCADCGQGTDPAQLVEHGAARLCANCAAKREKFAKRETARKTAVAEAALEESRRRRQMLIGAAIAAGVLVVAWVVYLVVS